MSILKVSGSGLSKGRSDNVTRITRVTLTDQVYEELKELVISGEAAPGERMTLRGLADAIGVSPMPVRDAVGRLVAENALEVLPNRAVRVPIMTRSKFIEIRMIRIELEGLAASLAAERRTDSDLKEIMIHHELFEKESKRREPDPIVAIRANRNLHFSIYRAAQSPALLSIIDGLWLQVGAIMNWGLRELPKRLHKVEKVEARQHHSKLVNALRAGKARAAQDAIVADIASGGEYILSRGKLPD